MCIAYTGKNNLLNYNSLSVCCGWEEYSLERKEKKTFGAFCGVPGFLLVSIVGRSKSLIN